MPLLSLSEVAKRTGKARSSIYRLIDEGKLSATLDHQGRKCVELTEVLRVFGAIKNETGQEDTGRDASNKTVRTARLSNETGQDIVAALMQELAQARAELQFKDRELGLMQNRVDELKTMREQAVAEKNRFLEIIERQSLLLAAPKPARQLVPATKKVTPPPTAAKSLPKTIQKTPASKPKAPPSVTPAAKTAKAKPAVVPPPRRK